LDLALKLRGLMTKHWMTQWWVSSLVSTLKVAHPTYSTERVQTILLPAKCLLVAFNRIQCMDGGKLLLVAVQPRLGTIW
jgi:hypothetical protein